METKQSTSDFGVRDGRVQWSRQLDFFLSLVGYCVGLGNLWRFPYFCNRNGGGAFLIPYLIVLMVIGMPLFFIELSIGQFSGRGAQHVWSICPLFKGLGYTMSIASLLCSFYFILIIAWVLYYLVMSCFPTLPWTTCSEWWNTPSCVTWDQLSQSRSRTYNMTSENLTTFPIGLRFNITNGSKSAVEEFWQHNTLRVSDSLGDLGGIQWHLVAALFAAWVLIFLCLIKGVKSVGKVVYVTATLPYILITVILCKAVTLPGARDGIVYYIKPDFSKLANIQVWLEATLQMFYSLGVTWGGLHTMASYNKFTNNCLRDAVVITFLSEGTSFYAGFAIFSVLGFMADKMNLHVSEVIRAGPGLGFVAYPEALAQLPVPQLWAFLFFIMLLTVGIDSQFGTMETVITAVVDTFPKQLQPRRTLVTGLMCSLCFLFGLFLTTNGAIYIFMLIDWYVGTFSLLFVGIFECVIIGWIYGSDRFCSDVEMMLGRKPPIIFKILICFVTPIIMTMCLLLTMVQYKSPSYGDYLYPTHGVVLGWIIAVLPMLPVPICMLREVLRREGSFLQRLKKSLKPEPCWGPNSDQHRDIYFQLSERPRFKKLVQMHKW